MTPCSCGFELAPGFIFCPKCGRQVAPIEPEVLGEPEIVLEFGHSSSVEFPRAVEMAGELGALEVEGEGRRATYRVALRRARLAEAHALVDLIGSWRRRRAFVDDKEIPWRELFAYRWCFDRRQQAYRPEPYCFGLDAARPWSFNPVGCILAQFEFSSMGWWCTWGSFINAAGDWEYDKRRILEHVRQHLWNVRFCPVLDPSLAEEVVEALPFPVNPKRDRNWEYVLEASMSYDLVGGVEHRKARGVAPKGIEAAKEVIGRMRRPSLVSMMPG